MLKVEFTGQFKKDYKLAVKRGCDPKELEKVITLLVNEQPLPEKYRDHALTNFITFRKSVAAGLGKQEADHSGKFQGLHYPTWLSQEQKADQQADIPELHCHVSEARQINMNISEIALPQKQCNFYYPNNCTAMVFHRQNCLRTGRAMSPNCTAW